MIFGWFLTGVYSVTILSWMLKRITWVDVAITFTMIATIAGTNP